MAKRKIVEQTASYGSADLTQPGVTAEPVVTGNSARPADNQTGDPGNTGVMSPEQMANLQQAAAISRSQMIAQIVDKAAAMSGDELASLHDDLYGPRENPSDAIAGNAAASNLATLSTYNEELEAAFEGIDLTEEAKTKIKTLFESTVSATVTLIEAELQEEFQEKLEEGVSEAIDTMVEHVDNYASKVAEQYLIENKLAVVDTARVQLAESFMLKLKGVLAESFFDIEAEQASSFAAAQTELDATKKIAIEEMQKNKSLTEQLNKTTKALVIERHSYGLTVGQREKLQTLSESVSFTNEAEYEGKVKVLIESKVRVASPAPTTSAPAELLIEEASAEKQEKIDPTVAAVLKSIRNRA